MSRLHGVAVLHQQHDPLAVAGLLKPAMVADLNRLLGPRDAVTIADSALCAHPAQGDSPALDRRVTESVRLGE